MDQQRKILFIENSLFPPVAEKVCVHRVSRPPSGLLPGVFQQVVRPMLSTQQVRQVPTTPGTSRVVLLMTITDLQIFANCGEM